MQVSVEKTSSLERKLRVEVPEDKIAGEVENRLKSMSRTTRIDGFRPGKVPLKLVQKRYGERVRAEVVGETVRTTFYEAVNQEKLRPAGMPKIDPLDDSAGNGLSYTATFEVYPEIQVKPVKELKIERPQCDINDADLDQMIEVLRKQQRQPETVERAAADGDIVIVDFVGRIDGDVFEGGEAQDFSIELGSNRLIPGFEEGLVGAAAGETRTLKLAFPDNYGKQELAGKAVEFEVTVKTVQEQKLPELNAEFFAAFGVQDGDESAFREEVRKNMGREAEQTLRSRLKENVLDAIYAANSVELPGALVEAEQQNLLEQAKQNLRQYGATDEQLDGLDASPYLEQAQKRVALQLLVGELIKENDLKAEPNEVRALLEKSAASYEDPQAVINWYYSDKTRLREVEALALEDKLIDWILGQARVTDKPYTFDALMNKGQTA
ncbi:MAG: trigger factor [Gammaproteobacteria bacterium]